MAPRPIAFRVETNKSKSSFWYTLVAGNGDTVMTSKSTYAEKASAKRAAKRQIENLQSADLMLEYENEDGLWVQETVEAEAPNPVRVARRKIEIPEPSTRVADERLNPNF